MDERPNPLDAVGFDDAAFSLVRDEPKLRAWTTPAGDPLLLHYREALPDIEAPLHDLAKLRAFYAREIARSGGAVIDVNTFVVERCIAIRLLLRADVATAERRIVASLTLPFRVSSYVLNLRCDARAGADDPLSRARGTLAQIERTLRLDASLRALPRFTWMP
ncbi:MAG TPA: hypothetical protein VGM56_09425 [Byssovorax sp.]